MEYIPQTGRWKSVRNQSKIRDLTGQKIGHLTAVRISSHSPLVWECKCDCGNTHYVLASNLRTGQVKSCGCAMHPGHPTHNQSTTRLYRIYAGIKTRCYNPNDQAYHNYGGRGIVMCEEWTASFEAFAKWARENGYSENLSIDRIDNDGNYSPENCRWATAYEQSNNRRRTRLFSYQGRTQSLMQWCNELGLNHNRIQSRVTHGWSFEEAILHKEDARIVFRGRRNENGIA